MAGKQASPADGRIRVTVYGTFAVAAPDGAPLTPRSAKSCAIIAMLATAPGARRSRSWIQNRLWSDRGPHQAFGSLRQALLDIRRTLGPYSAVLRASRAAAELDPALFVVEPPPEQGETEFLHELDIRDPAFAEWLKDMRQPPTSGSKAGAMEGAARMSMPPRPTVVIDIAALQPEFAFSAGVMRDQLARSLAEMADVDVIRGPLTLEGTQGVPPGTLLAQAQLVALPPGGVWIRASLEDIERPAIHWSASLKISTPVHQIDDDVQVLGLTHQLTIATVDALARLTPPADSGGSYQSAVMAASAFRRMFKLQHHELEAAAALLDQAIAMSPRGLYHALRAQLSAIRFVERQADGRELRERSEADIVAALAAEPQNSSVLASVANARLIFGNDVESSLVLSRQGVKANRSNPLAWWSLANAMLYSGDLDSAYKAAIFAQGLAENTSLKAWADFQRSLTAAVQGGIREGITFAQSAHALSPNFRPPLRYLIAMQASTGAMEASRTSVRKLSALEPDFTVDRMMSDPAYPASMLRKSKIADKEKLKAV
jgi:tetratricopeptide (TPR) repeat protein